MTLERHRIAVAGATGFIGTALVAHLERAGHRITRISRGRPRDGTDDIQWDPAAGRLDAPRLEGFDVVINVAGENIGERWSAAAKRRIRASRVDATRLLAERLSGLERPPRILVNASAVGIYGNGRDGEPLDEGASTGEDFLAQVVRAWEAATAPAEQRGIRVVLPRFGLVIAAGGGVLAKLLTPMRLGLGGTIGSGRQWVSWVAMDDATRAVEFLITTTGLAGAVNVTAPNPVTNAEMTHALGDVLGRPTFAHVPEFAIKLALGGEMAEETVLASQRALPTRLLRAGFTFHYPTFEPALRHALGREGVPA
jgi:uncharacterized protein (TIGR01777 family)